MHINRGVEARYKLIKQGLLMAYLLLLRVEKLLVQVILAVYILLHVLETVVLVYRQPHLSSIIRCKTFFILV